MWKIGGLLGSISDTVVEVLNVEALIEIAQDVSGGAGNNVAHYCRYSSPPKPVFVASPLLAVVEYRAAPPPADLRGQRNVENT
jgi:hypothetical protein